jgi:hypothetical protein
MLDRGERNVMYLNEKEIRGESIFVQRPWILWVRIGIELA